MLKVSDEKNLVKNIIGKRYYDYILINLMTK